MYHLWCTPDRCAVYTACEIEKWWMSTVQDCCHTVLGTVLYVIIMAHCPLNNREGEGQAMLAIVQ